MDEVKKAMEDVKKVDHKKSEESKQKTIDKTQDEKIIELTSTLQRLQAEFENFKKRNEKEKSECIKYASKDIILKILPILDNFELALKNTDKKEDFVKGMELIYSQLFTILEQEGLKIMQAKGKQFDPYQHEALMTEESKEKENTVLEVFQKGYTLKDNILRHAKVKVAKNADKK